MLKYRESIGANNYLFGTELEFKSVYLSKVCEYLRSIYFPFRFTLCHKTRGFTKYDEWYIDIDNTVSKREGLEFLGGEASSRILKDEISTWKEIKDLCDCLRLLGAYIDGKCSNHVRVNLKDLKNERYFFEVLAKLIAIYETDIRLFYMGDKYLIREEIYDHARPMGWHLLDYINKVDFSGKDIFYDFKRNPHNGINYFSRSDGINIQEYLEKRLIEFRYANGSIDEVTIQNNINFTIKLVDAIKRELFDPKELTYIIEHNNDLLRNNDLFGFETPSNFEILVSTISTSSEDVNYFNTQYERVLSTKPRN